MIKFFSTPGLINYGDYILATGRGITKLIVDKLDFTEQKKNQLLNFGIKPIVPFGIPEYEVSFCAKNTFLGTPEGSHELLYPDMNTLG